MTESNKISPNHLNRTAFVYVRQSTTTQVEHHRESTERQLYVRFETRGLFAAVQLQSENHAIANATSSATTLAPGLVRTQG